jgi:hypothetical protein
MTIVAAPKPVNTVVGAGESATAYQTFPFDDPAPTRW